MRRSAYYIIILVSIVVFEDYSLFLAQRLGVFLSDALLFMTKNISNTDRHRQGSSLIYDGISSMLIMKREDIRIMVMKNKSELEITINRVQQMECIFDWVQNTMQNTSSSWTENDTVKEMLQRLITYYESGQWLRDYECDERGELPTDLKLGVLSQDGIYNLLFEIGQKGGRLYGK